MGRKEGFSSHAFSKWKAMNLGSVVVIVMSSGKWSEVARVLGSTSLMGRFMKDLSKRARVGSVLMLDQLKR